MGIQEKMEKKTNKIEKIEIVLMGFLMASLGLSIAGMEFFGWSLTLLSLIVAFAEWVRGKKQELAVGPDWALWTLWGVAVLGVWVNGDEGSNIRYVIGNFRWIVLLYGYSLALKRINPDTLQKFFWKITLPVMGVVSVYGIIQAFTGIDLIRPGREVHSLELADTLIFRSSGFFNNPMTFAHLFVMWFCIVLGILWQGEKILSVQQKRILKTVSLVVGLALILSLIRGVWISASVAILMMLWWWRRKAFYRGLVAMMIVGGVAVVSIPPLRDRAQSIFSTRNVENRDRITLWKANWEIFKDHPWIGIGYTENERRIGEYYERMGVIDGFHGHAHNVYLQFLSGTGLLGFICYLVFIGYFLILSCRLWKWIPEKDWWPKAFILGALGAQVSLHIGALTQNNFSDGEVTHNFIFILAIVISIRHIYWKKSSLTA